MESAYAATNLPITWLHQSKYASVVNFCSLLTCWSWVTRICFGRLTIIGSDNGLSPRWCQAIIWTNAGILLIGPLGPNFSEILIAIQTFSLRKICLKMSSAKYCPFHLNVFMHILMIPVHNFCLICRIYQSSRLNNMLPLLKKKFKKTNKTCFHYCCAVYDVC